MTISSRSEHTLRLLAPSLWAVVILWLSITPSPPQLPGVLGWDKLLHAGAYGLLALLVAQAFLCWSVSLERALSLTLIVVITYGTLLEILQMLAQTGRVFEWFDILADGIGAFLACVIFRQAARAFCRHDSAQEQNNG